MTPEPRIALYARWLRDERGLAFDDYEAMWRWSVDDLAGFWQSIWDYFAIESPTPHAAVLAEDRMPGAKWFPGARVNFARQVFRHADDAHAAGHPAIVFRDEALAARGELRELSWPELRRQVASLAAALRGMGVQPGERVCAVLPNTPETVVAFLAVASVGAVWSVCSPDMGPVAVLDRFRQIAPRVLIACDGYRYGGKTYDRSALVGELVAQLPSVEQVVLWRAVDAGQDAHARVAGAGRPVHDFKALAAGDAAFEPAWLDFDHPLWIVYSSGTTGLPKPIVHGHGGVMLEMLKLGSLHNDLGPSVQTGDRFLWYSATGWIMWNCQVGGLLAGTTIALYDGSPAWNALTGQNDWTALWRFVADAGVSFFGAGAAFYASCLKADVHPATCGKLARLRAVGSTGSPLSNECYRWIWERVPAVDGAPVWIAVISGGTDFAGAFIAGNRTLPVVEGEMQCRCLGAAVYAWSDPDASGRGRELVDEVGELVCARPMPSMPLYLWGDTDGSRLHDSYFDMYPGVWRHGDWIRITRAGGAIIYGRSDATINRHGIRMGTAELYRAVEAMPEVLDSLVVDLEYLGRPSCLLLFVVLREGHTLDAPLVDRMRAAIRAALSARHVPDEFIQVGAVPRTMSGKKMELPVKKLLLGHDPARVLNRDAMQNPECVSWYLEFARERTAGGPPDRAAT